MASPTALLLAIAVLLLLIVIQQLPETQRPSNPFAKSTALRRLATWLGKTSARILRAAARVAAAAASWLAREAPAGSSPASWRCGCSLRRVAPWLAAGTAVALLASGALTLRPGRDAASGHGNKDDDDRARGHSEVLRGVEAVGGAARFGAVATRLRRPSSLLPAEALGSEQPRSYPTPQCPPRPINASGQSPRIVRVGEPLLDEDGNAVHAHGGGVLVPHQAGGGHDRYFWCV